MKPFVSILQKMSETGLDALLVTDEKNIRYLSGFAFTDGYLLLTQQKNYLITDFRYVEDAKRRADPAFEVVVPPSRTAFLTDVLSQFKDCKIGYEDLSLSCAEYRNLCE